jgi:cytochrome c
MFKSFLVFAVVLTTVFTASAGWADDRANATEAEAMVKKAVAFIKTNGAEKAYAAFTAKDPGFIDRDLYVVVYGMDGTVRAHGQSKELVGQNLSDAQDVDGKYYVRERVRLAVAQPNFWQEYKFTDPLTKKIAPKRMYCERLNDSVVCGGIYK